MTLSYFNSLEVTAIAICAALWGVLNSIISPVFFRVFHVPFLCDIIGFGILVVAAWWINKFGAITIIGIIATMINFAFNSSGFHFFGFTVVSFLFDVLSRVFFNRTSYSNKFRVMFYGVIISSLSAAVAGYLIGLFFMAQTILESWGGVLIWAGLHTFGGIVGGSVGSFLVTTLTARRVAIDVVKDA